MLELRHVPIEVLWRTIDLLGVERPSSYSECLSVIEGAELDAPIGDESADEPSAFARAICEFLSATGAFHYENGSMAGGGTYRIVGGKNYG